MYRSSECVCVDLLLILTMIEMDTNVPLFSEPSSYTCTTQKPMYVYIFMQTYCPEFVQCE